MLDESNIDPLCTSDGHRLTPEVEDYGEPTANRRRRGRRCWVWLEPFQKKLRKTMERKREATENTAEKDST